MLLPFSEYLINGEKEQRKLHANFSKWIFLLFKFSVIRIISDFPWVFKLQRVHCNYFQLTLKMLDCISGLLFLDYPLENSASYILLRRIKYISNRHNFFTHVLLHIMKVRRIIYPYICVYWIEFIAFLFSFFFHA